jgi:hypothetical protein
LWCRADGKAAMFDVSHMGQVRQTNCSSNNHNDNPPSNGYSEQCLHFSRECSLLLRFSNVDSLAWKGSSQVPRNDCRGRHCWIGARKWTP